MRYIKVNMEHFDRGLKPIDVLILSVIESFNNDQKICYCTNEQLATMFSVAEPTVANALDRLEKENYITRNTKVIKKNGSFTKRRILTLVKKGE